MHSQNGRDHRDNRHFIKRVTPKLLWVLAAACVSLGCASSQTGRLSSPDLKPSGADSFQSRTNLLTNHMARNQDGTINVIIEIPAGTSEKWEVSSDGFSLAREFKGEKPRTIEYLPYPGNYGFVPRTLLDPQKGGDGGALDVMVLGPAVKRGDLIRAHPIGVIRLVDHMEQDDKILAVTEGTSFEKIYDIDSLKKGFPGVIEILDIWWTHAYGKGTDVSLLGTGSRAQANSIINYAMDSWLSMRRDTRKASEAEANSGK